MDDRAARQQNVVNTWIPILKPQTILDTTQVLDLDAADIEPHDLVLALDGATRQPTRERYEQFCQRLLALCRRYGLVAGYNQQPWIPRVEMTFYYEPITHTLNRLGGERTWEIAGGYEDITVVLWIRP